MIGAEGGEQLATVTGGMEYSCNAEPDGRDVKYKRREILIRALQGEPPFGEAVLQA